MSRVAEVEESAMWAEQGVGQGSMEVKPVVPGEGGTDGTQEAVSREPREAEAGEKAESGGEDRSRPSVAAASQPTAFEITTGTLEATAEGPTTEAEQHQSALNQLIRLFGQNQAVQILERYVLAAVPITLDQARGQTAVEVPGAEQLQEAAQILMQEQQILDKDVIKLTSDGEMLQ